MKTATNLSVTTTIAVALLVLAGCKTPSSSPPPEKATAIELFNGTNLDGWTFCMKNDSDPAKTWSVRDGVIHCTGLPYGYARTTQMYHDYKLTCIWRFVKVAPHRDNSGIFVHIQPPDKVWATSVECQGLYQHQGDIYLQPGFGADGHPIARKATLIPQMGPPNENPAGEWGTNTVICNGGTIGLFRISPITNRHLVSR